MPINPPPNQRTRMRPRNGGPRRIGPDGRPVTQSQETRRRRVQQKQTLKAPRRPRRKGWMKKALPYIIAGGSTGGSIGFGAYEFFNFFTG